MGCAQMGKTAIVSLNSSFLLLSFGLLVISLLVQYNEDILNDILGMATDALKSSLDSVKQVTSEMMPGKFDISAEDIRDLIKALLQNISKPLVIISATFIVISGAGLLGGCCKSKCFLVLYCLFLVLIVLAEAGFLALFLLPGTMIDKYIKTVLREGLQLRNFGISDSVITKIWMAIMDKLQCCGLEGSGDFNETLWMINKTDNFKVPIQCCKNLTAAYIDTTPQCALNPTVNNSNFQQGCYKAMTDKIFESQLSVGIFSGVWVVIFLLELVLLFSAVAVVKESLDRNKKVHPGSRSRRRRR